MTVNDIVFKARKALGDTDKTGWDDITLSDYVDQAQKDLCKEANIYKRTLYMGLLQDVELYALPSDCFQVERVEYRGRALDILSREDQDNRYTYKALHVIKSDLNMTQIEISEHIKATNYATMIEGVKIKDIDIVNTPTPIVGVATDAGHPQISVANPLGVTVGLGIAYPNIDRMDFGDLSGYKTSQVKQTQPNTANLGVLTQMNFEDDNRGGYYGLLYRINNSYCEGTYGPCTDVFAADTHLRVYYSAISYTVNSLYDALIAHPMWEKALVHYVVGTARMNDNDEGNYQIGMKEMGMYQEEVKKAKKLSARTYSSSVSEIKETTYRRI